MNQQEIFFFCGPHCCGKTSILTKLKLEGIISERGTEIGKDLFYSRHFETSSQNSSFEIEICRRELQRDITYAGKTGIIGIETWHPGNLAYAKVRNPNIVPFLTKLISESPLLHACKGFRFNLSKESIFGRTKTFANNREWAVDFYTTIDSVLDECISLLDLNNRIIEVDANLPFDVVYDKVKRHILNI